MRRRLDQPGDHRRLAEAQLLRRMAEELARRRVDAIGAAAVIDLVHIQLEDLVLREFAPEREREDRLMGSACTWVFVRQEDRARNMLGDRLGALVEPSGHPINTTQLARIVTSDWKSGSGHVE